MASSFARFIAKQFRRQPYYKMRSSVECSRAHTGGLWCSAIVLYYTVLIQLHMSKEGISYYYYYIRNGFFPGQPG